MPDRRQTIRLALGAALLPLAARAQEGPLLEAPPLPEPRAVTHDPDAPALGNPQGDVTVVCWFDYQCPYCKAEYPMLMAELDRDPGLRLVMKDLPLLGPLSLLAAQRVLGTVRQGGYAPALDALMRARGRLTPAGIDRGLARAGIAPAEAERAYRAAADLWAGLLRRNLLQAEAFGLIGTPAYLVGRDLFPGTVGRANLRAAIRSARAG
ncbi:DsbA family protein [Frigidibacter oleivorans]|uniref:DsbA family protein n=1 Tax=Frigidibacter oleivorans TaxID=2487129 RepID=UPI000F8F661C|nr:DsbA family protein [Frigidibacter oleivorans]